MGSLAIAGKFAILEMGNTAPPTPPTAWSTLTEVYEIGDINFHRSRYDTTHHGPSIFRSQIVGLCDIIDVTASLNYVAAQYDAIYAIWINGELNWWRLWWPDDTNHVFESYVGEITDTTPLDERITYSIILSSTQDFFRNYSE